MRAAVLHRYGGPDALTVEDRPSPVLGPRDVRIAVEAASLNPIDYKIRDGSLRPVLRLTFPIGLGSDVAGVVREIGSAVTRVAVGDAVYARLEKERMGGLAEEVAADEGVVARRPTTIDAVEAASLPLAGLTALQALRDVIGLQPGQRVLVTAGAGGVGTLAIQIGKILGGVVLTTTSTKNVDFVRELGADEVVDYTKGEPGEQLRDLDAVFDPVGYASELSLIGSMRRGGVMVGIGGTPDEAFAREHLAFYLRPAIAFMTRKRRRQLADAGVRYHYLFMRPDGRGLEELAAWVDAKRLRPVVHEVFGFDRIREAFAELERGRARGKIVVRVTG